MERRQGKNGTEGRLETTRQGDEERRNRVTLNYGIKEHKEIKQRDTKQRDRKIHKTEELLSATKQVGCDTRP